MYLRASTCLWLGFSNEFPVQNLLIVRAILSELLLQCVHALELCLALVEDIADAFSAGVSRYLVLECSWV